MKIKIVVSCSILFISIILINNVNALENDLANGSVYFNGKEATVYDASLKVNEPATIKAEIYLKKNIDVSTGITASGFDWRDPNQPFKVIEGPSEFTETARIFNHNAGDVIIFEWVIQPTEIAAGWTIPLNIDFNFYDRDEKESYPIEFTVANIQILNEQYSGSTPKPTSDPSSTDQPASSEGSPGFGILASLIGVAVVVLTTKHIRR